MIYYLNIISKNACGVNLVEEENLLQMIIQKDSWEEVLYHIVSLENIDPWDVDLVKLTEGFLRYIRSAKQLDFRIPAKVVFVAAILLKLKSEYLSIFEESSAVEEVLEKEKEFVDLGIDPNLVKLGLPMKRAPKRQVTLDELIVALKKALSVRERRVERSQRIRQRLRRELKAHDDMIKRIEKIMAVIEQRIKLSGHEKLRFRDIVDKWEREDIVNHFVPILHLEKNQKLATEQEDYFKEIFISKK